MKKLLPLLTMLYMVLFAGIATAQESLTLYDGSQQNDKVPFYCYWGDMTNGTKSQTIYPDTVLTSLVGKKITKITYYNNGGDFNFTQNLIVKIGTTNQHGYLNYNDAITTGLITMYQGPVSISNHQVEITLNQPWAYNGGNIVISLHLQQGVCTPTSSYYWVGKTSNAYSSAYQYGPDNLSNVVDFFPKTTFTYVDGDGPGPGDIDPDEEPIDDVLYVSASGVVKTHVPAYYIDADGKVFDFENDAEENRFVNWRAVDADGDSKNWMVRYMPGEGHNGSNGLAVSYSYDNASNQALNPDNYLISDRIQITNNNKKMTFFGRAMDEDYPADKFGVGVSTTTDDPSSFTMLQTWTMTAGGWHSYTVDLSNYVGQTIYVAIRHYNCSDNFCLAIDDVVFNDGNMSQLVSCTLKNDNTMVTSNLTDDVYLLNADNYTEGSTHNTELVATYMSNQTIERSHTWTFHTPDHFQGSPSGLFLESDGNSVTLSWSLPTMEYPMTVDELYYNFADSTFGDLMLKDANNDGMNWKLYPLNGYYDGSDYLPYFYYNDGFARMCIKSESWVNVQGEGVELHPDNYIYTPKVTITENSKISFLAAYAYFANASDSPEHIGVAVSDDGVNFTMVKDWWIDTHEYMTYHEYVADLSAYAGQQKHVAIRHYTNIDNAYFVQVDNIRVSGIEATVTAKAVGAVVYCNGQPIKILNHGEQSFIHNVNRYESNYCIRIIQAGPRTGRYYALAEPQCVGSDMECPAPVNLTGVLEDGNVTLSWEKNIFSDFSEDPQGWSILDGDGDGNSFGIYNIGGMTSPGSQPDTETENASLMSASAMNGEEGAIELHPNNYAFMPLLKLLENAKVTFYAAGLDPNYPAEQVGVVIADSEATSITELATWTTTANYTEYTVDLSQYAGETLFVGFHHFTAQSQYYLCIDNVTVTNAVIAGTESELQHFNIYRSIDGQNFVLIGSTDSDIETSFVDNIANASTDYYFYQVTAVNSIPGGETCESVPTNVVVIETDGINEENNGVSVYPNPTKGQLNIIAQGMKRITVMNTLGQVVYEVNANDDNAVIDMTNFGSGMYMLSITTDEGVTVKRVNVVK